MAINFPSNPTNAQEITEGNVTYVYNATKGYWESSEVSSGASIDVLADMTALIAKTGMSNGDQAFVTGNNNLYIYSGTGWYKIATVQNDSPSAISGVDGSYSLAIDGTPTVITAVSSDPEGFPLTWSYSTSGLGSIATVSQADNVFTITPSTNDANIGTFTLTINATDGVNGAVSANTSITLEFIIANSNYTTLLATAVDTSDNNNITDSSSNNHTITVTGDAHAGTFSPYRHGGYSTYFDGSSDYIQVPAGAFALSTGDFTIETWVYFNSITTGAVSDNTQYTIYDARVASTGTDHFIVITTSGDVRIRMNGIRTIELDETLESGKWYHLALVNSSGTVTLFLNGTANATTFTTSANLSIGAAVEIGGSSTFSGYLLNGYLRDFRVVIGTAVYTSTFTPPTEPLTAITNTSLLTCHLPYFKDGSSNAHAITVYGNTSTKPFGPYDYYNVYSASDNGGSVSMPNDNEYLYVPHSSTLKPSGTDPFCVSFWYYPTTSPGTDRQLVGDFQVVSYPSNCPGWDILYQTSGAINARWGYPNYADTGSGITNNIPIINAWNHIVFCRSGGNLSLFLNGKRCNTFTSNISISASGLANFYVGYAGEASGSAMNTAMGTIADFKYEVGTSQFDATASTITVPTAPQSTTNSVLHVKGTDASIIDKSQSSNLKLFGNTTGSTTQIKFADTKSMYFDGTGDYIRIGNNKDTLDGFINNNEIMTVEGWVYPTLSRAGSNIYQSPCILNIGSTYFHLGLNNLTPFFYWWTGAANSFSASNPITLNAWSHIALVLDANTGSNNLKLYVNGNLDGQGTFGGISWASSSQGDEVRIGIGNNADANSYFPGYIQDLRITKGLARYTGNFTPPTIPLKG